MLFKYSKCMPNFWELIYLYFDVNLLIVFSIFFFGGGRAFIYEMIEANLALHTSYLSPCIQDAVVE